MNEAQPLTLEKFESTMSDVCVRFDGFESTIANLWHVTDLRFEKFESMMSDFMSAVNARFDRNEEVIQSLVVGQSLLLEETRDIKRRVVGLEYSMDDVQYSISTLTRAEEKDAEATINHENRLQRLEKLNKIKAISPAHLIGASE
jgi:hypothetical protein